MCCHLSEKRQKAVLLGPDKFQTHTNEGKGKSGEEERRRRQKSNGCSLNV